MMGLGTSVRSQRWQWGGADGFGVAPSPSLVKLFCLIPAPCPDREKLMISMVISKVKGFKVEYQRSQRLNFRISKVKIHTSGQIRWIITFECTKQRELIVSQQLTFTLTVKSTVGRDRSKTQYEQDRRRLKWTAFKQEFLSQWRPSPVVNHHEQLIKLKQEGKEAIYIEEF